MYYARKLYCKVMQAHHKMQRLIVISAAIFLDITVYLNNSKTQLSSKKKSNQTVANCIFALSLKKSFKMTFCKMNFFYEVLLQATTFESLPKN